MNPSPANLKSLFLDIDKLCQLPFPKLKPLDDFKIKPPIYPVNESTGKKYPKSKKELQKLFNDIEKLCHNVLPFKLGDLDEIDPVKTCDHKNYPKSKKEVKKLFDDIEIFFRNQLPFKLSGLDEINHYSQHVIDEKNKKRISNYPKNKEELNNLFEDIDKFFRIDLSFKLGDLNEQDETINNEINKKHEITKDTENISSVSLERKKQLFREKYSFKNKNNLFTIFKFQNIKENSDGNERNQKKPNNRKKNKTNTKKMNNEKKRCSILLNPIDSIESNNMGLKSRIRSYQNYLATSKQIQSSGDYKSKKRKLIPTKEIIDFDYCPSSQSSVSSSSSSEYFSSPHSSSSSTSSICSLLSNTNPNGKIIFLCNQYERFMEKLSNKQHHVSASKSKTINKQMKKVCDVSTIDQHKNVIEWSTKTLLDCRTPEYNFFGQTPPSSVTDEHSKETNQIKQTILHDDIIDLDCLDDLIFDVHFNENNSIACE